MVRSVTQAPPLAACVIEAGSVMVIPADAADPCEAAEMGTWTEEAQYEAVGAAIHAALVSLYDRDKASTAVGAQRKRIGEARLRRSWDRPATPGR